MGHLTGGYDGKASCNCDPEALERILRETSVRIYAPSEQGCLQNPGLFPWLPSMGSIHGIKICDNHYSEEAPRVEREKNVLAKGQGGNLKTTRQDNPTSGVI